jgi:imidazolonepropionase-like amidohydrolase
MSGELLLRGASIVDATRAEPEGPVDVLVRDRHIATVGSGATAGNSASILDGTGSWLLPGLTDAHVHFALITAEGVPDVEPWVMHVLRVAQMIAGALQEGFTTVRDAGGLEPAWARAVAEGLVDGPRILPSGSVLSQTGGHGDVRVAHEAVHRASIPGLVAMPEIVDGIDAVRRAAREQLRRGATQVKLLASGGIVSPTDPFDSRQFSHDEIAAAVDVAADWETYVLAHCHTSPAMDRAIAAGVRSIEHGSVLEPDTAARMADRDVFMVPTLQALEMLAAHPERWKLQPEKVARLADVRDAAYRSVAIAGEAGVAIGSGSDVVGPWQGRRGEEIALKAKVLGPHRAIASATLTNARLFGMEDRIGTVEVGMEADLVLVEGNPLDEIGLLANPDSISVVIKGGRIVKDAEGRSRATAASEV